MNTGLLRHPLPLQTMNTQGRPRHVTKERHLLTASCTRTAGSRAVVVQVQKEDRTQDDDESKHGVQREPRSLARSPSRRVITIPRAEPAVWGDAGPGQANNPRRRT